MIKVICFENMKFWRSRKNVAVFVIFALALVGMVAYNSALDRNYWSAQHAELERETVMIKHRINEVEEELAAVQAETPVDQERVKYLEQYIRYLNSQRVFNLRQVNHARMNNQDTEERLSLWIERDQHLLTILEQGYPFFDTTPAEVRQRLAVNQYLQDKGIKPLNSPYEMSAVNFLIQMTNYPWILIILIAIAMLNIDMFSGDMDGGAYKTLYSQPMKRKQILAGKFLLHFANSFLLITALVGVAFGILSLTRGMGAIDYPAYYYTASFLKLTVPAAENASDYLGFLPWTEYILKTLPLYTAVAGFFIALMGAASLLMRNTANVFSNLVCLLFLDFSIRTLFPVDSTLRMLWPLTAASLSSVMQGIYSLSASAYLILLGAMTAVLLLFSVLLLEKRDLTGGVN